MASFNFSCNSAKLTSRRGFFFGNQRDQVRIVLSIKIEIVQLMCDRFLRCFRKLIVLLTAMRYTQV